MLFVVFVGKIISFNFINVINAFVGLWLVPKYVPQEELVRRIHERAQISNRSDDTEEVIRHRLDEYEAKTRPVLDYYKVSGKLVSIDGSGEISETNPRLCQLMQHICEQ